MNAKTAQFVTSDSEHDSEGATPINETASDTLPHSKSTPGQIFNASDDFAAANPFDDDFDTDPFAEDNPNNPFTNPFGQNAFSVNRNYKKNKEQNKRTDAMREIKEKRSKTPEPEMPPIFNANNDPNRNPFHSQPKGVNRRHSQPVNSIYATRNNLEDLDDIFADFQPQQKQQQQRRQHKQHPVAAVASSAKSVPPGHKRSKSVMISAEEHSQLKKRRNSREVSEKEKGKEKELEVAQKTGYDISYFIDRDVAYKYLCIICENVCRNAVELTCVKKRHLCCSYCITKYFTIHGNKCPIHPEHRNLNYAASRYSKYHIESLRVQCPYSTASGIHGGCLWRDTLKNLDAHCIEHTQFVRCPFSDYGCAAKLKIESHHASNDEALREHLIAAQHQHLIYLLKKTQQLSQHLLQQNRMISELKENEVAFKQRIKYLSATQRIQSLDDNNIWILCGSHKYWKHKYNQLFTVNLRSECKTAIRIYDIERMSNNAAIKTNTNTSSAAGASTNNNGAGANTIYDPTQSDSWDVGDLGVAHVSNRFSIPIWLQKKYPILNCFNRDRFNSIIWRCGGHLIRDKKVTARVDAILIDNHSVTGNTTHPSTISMQNAAIPMQQLTGYKLNCFPTLPSKRYNCECVFSQRNGLIVVGGSGVDKNQINYVHQLKMRDQDVNITYNQKEAADDDDDDKKMDAYPISNSFNITLEWKSLAPIQRAREDTAICLFADKNIKWKEYMIICGGWSNGCLRSAELYNFGVNKWINLPAMNVKHNAAGIAQWKQNNSIVVVGGFNTEAHFACEYFEMVKQKWCKLPNTNYKHRYKPAVWCKQQVAPQIICCAGSGVLKNEVGTVEFLDTRDKKWAICKRPLAKLLGLNANINANNWRMWRIFT